VTKTDVTLFRLSMLVGKESIALDGALAICHRSSKSASNVSVRDQRFGLDEIFSKLRRALGDCFV
jgi:hypothetical protein